MTNPGLFSVVQDAFLTETAHLADVVLPAAIWGEKTGTFTNVDRTVHISNQAVDPPGEARSDFDTFLDYARRMDFRDNNGDPMLKFSTPEEAFSEFKEISSGKQCDYSALSYEKLTGGSGIQWPCNQQHPDGLERLYENHVFPTAADVCQAYGHNLVTGGAITPEQYRAHNPAGRAILKSADYEPLTELPDKHYPFRLTTGRVVYQFHTRTKTGRSPELERAAPDPFVQISTQDAEQLHIREGDFLRVTSRHGEIVVPARIGDIRPGHLFVPFHYATDSRANRTSPNELIPTQWDNISKQPYLKVAAVRLRKMSQAEAARHTRRTIQKASAMTKSDLTRTVVRTKPEIDEQPPRKQLLLHLNELRKLELSLEKSWKKIQRRHKHHFEVIQASERFSFWSARHASVLFLLIVEYGGAPARGENNLRIHLFRGPRHDAAGLVNDLQDISTLLQRAHLSYLLLGQAAKSLRHTETSTRLDELEGENHAQIEWCLTQL